MIQFKKRQTTITINISIIAEVNTSLTTDIVENNTSSTLEIAENNTSSAIEIVKNSTSLTFKIVEIIALLTTKINASSTVNIVSKSKKKFFNFRDIRFRYKNGLLYFIFDLIDLKRLYISKFIKTKIFRQIHDLTHHNNFIKIYDKLQHFIYVRFMIKRFKIYITHCSKYQINQIKRYSIYNKLNSIVSSIIFFHTIVMNFIIALLFNKKFDVLLIIICKFSKKILFIADYNI